MDRYQTGFQNLKSKKQGHEQQSKPPRLQKACWLWPHEVSELTDARQHYHLQHWGCNNRDDGWTGFEGRDLWLSVLSFP
jgi:hypothetical protein